MCLAIPGKVISIEYDSPTIRMAKVNFNGIIKEASLAYVPEAKVGDYVIVHVGFAISKIEEENAKQTFEYLEAIKKDQL
ncbi:MAG: HypC/HybG/HupF family hydrogenase formation chaperone [Candidatus Melainabacteria bacterium]|nr:HypC/HybG/HupF family hydrogenase formation chaperone [Candidatus Melainabacteria bacterium]